jgi:pimeloyl-ACP methyl ester carboxylesterase
MNQREPPDLDGVVHRYVTTPGGVTIHVADAGPADGPPVMLVHGFPQHWWEWHRLIGPLAAHDWGGPVAFILLLRHPELVTGFCGFNTIAPWLALDARTLRHAWRFYYQFPMLAPGLGPRLLGSPRQRYLRWLMRWVGGGYAWSGPDTEIYLERMREPARALAGSRWYRSFQAREALAWLRGEYADARVTVPVRWVTGLEDPVIMPVLHRGYAAHVSDLGFEEVPGVGHWIIEQAPDLVLDRLRRFLSD